MNIKQQIINAHKRGLSVKLIAECSHLTEKQVRRIINGHRTIQREQEATKENIKGNEK